MASDDVHQGDGYTDSHLVFQNSLKDIMEGNRRDSTIQPHVENSEQESTIDQIPSRDDLLNLFIEITKNGNPSDIPITELVQLLGGINKIMNVMLKAPNHSMSTNDRIKMQQLLQRHLQKPSEVISDNQKSREHVQKPSLDINELDRVPAFPKRVRSWSPVAQDVGWTLDPKNNILHDLSPRLEHFIFSKYMLVILFVFGALIVLLPAEGMIMEIFTIVVTWLCFIPWDIAALMSVNREMIPRIVSEVDTWIKSITMVIAMVYTLIYNIMSSEDSMALHIAFSITAATNLSLLIIVLCSIDGIHQWGTKARIFLVMTFAAFASFWSVIFHFFAEERIVTIPALGEWSSFSIRDRVATAWEILFIFLWKEAFLTWRRHRNRCITIRYAPFIDWNGQSGSQLSENRPKQEGCALWCSCCSGCPLPF